MSTAVADQKVYFATDNRPEKTFQGHPIDHQKDGSAIVRGVEIFKAGTFRDSLGDQHTWLPEHLTQMASNFNLLKNKGIFPNVPARRDHSFSIDKVMGYIESLTVKAGKLLSDIHVTEPTEVDKLARGTYRSVSLEVGMYTDNDEAMYWPVVFGVAYVDIPAVEGLHNKSKDISYFSRVNQGEGQMPEAQVDDRPPQTVINFNGLPGHTGQATGQVTTAGTPGQPAPAPAPAPSPAPSPNPAPAPAPTPATPPTGSFRIAGAETQDFGAVQRHIDSLELTLKTVDEANRKGFVKGLVDNKQVLAAQQPALEAFALKLDAASYAEWAKTYEGSAALPLLQNYGQGAGDNTGNPDAGNNETDPVKDRIEVLTETIKDFRRIGWNEEKIATTEIGKELARLTAKS
jgi:hypothetical protein